MATAYFDDHGILLIEDTLGLPGDHMAPDHIENAFRLRIKDVNTDRELVNKVFQLPAYDGDLERVADVTKRLPVQGAPDVSDWLKWAEERCNDPQWIPFHLDTRNGATEFDRNMSGKFGRVAGLVRSVLEDHQTNLECEGNKG